MLFFNKFLPLFVLPIGWVTFLLLFALWKKQRWPILVALAVLWIGSMPCVGARLIGWVESKYPALPVATAGPADAIVVLGGIIGPRVEPGSVANLMETGERFEAGVALQQAGRAPHLVFTGAKMGWPDGKTEGDELKRLALTRGVPTESVLVTDFVGNTADEARVVAGMMQARGWQKVILVTSAWHMPRAAYQFKRAGVECIIFPVDFRFDGTRTLSAIDFVPRGEAWMNTETALRELYGYWFYRVFR